MRLEPEEGGKDGGTEPQCRGQSPALLDASSTAPCVTQHPLLKDGTPGLGFFLLSKAAVLSR